MSRALSILKVLDKLLCNFFGIERQEIHPEFLLVSDKHEIQIKYTESYKRHLFRNALSKIDIGKINKSDKKDLGYALGGSIAENLNIVFEVPKIRRKL